jgi:hypothetical protein
MLSADFKNQIVNLSVSDRLDLIQTIVASLQNQPLATQVSTTDPSASDYFESGQTYEVWTPIDAPEAAQVLLDLLAAEDMRKFSSICSSRQDMQKISHY